MNIAFFISDHGFGHIMRNLAVIGELLNNGHKVVLITSKKHIELAVPYLEKESTIANLICIPMNTDGGLIVKPGTLVVDKEATGNMVVEYVKTFPERINIALDLLDKYEIKRVVVDIVPWALTAAKKKKIKSYIMASFTWMEQYEEYVDKETLAILDKCFNDVDEVLLYEVANKPTIERYSKHKKVGFVARPFHMDKVIEIKSRHKQPIVYLSVGGSNSGLDFDIDVSSLPYDFITTEGLRLKGENVTFLSVDIENTQDYIKAAEFCISKAGWGSVAELMLAGGKTALIERPDVPEDTMIITDLENRNEIMSVSVNELMDIGAVIQKMENKQWNKPNYTNGYKYVASIVIR